MEISVVIPTWNRADRLPQAIASVTAQSRPPREIIVVDDGSTDNTRALVSRRFRDVRYIYQENGGVSRARNSGIRAATGDWIALLDSDDRWRPAKLEQQITALRQAPEFRVCHTDEVWIRHGRRANPMKKHAKHGGDIFRHCLPRCAMSPSAVLLRRDVLESTGLFDESLPACEDYDLWLRICAVFPVLYIDSPLVIKYGGHNDQLSRRYWGMDRFRIHALEKILAAGGLSAENYTAALKTLQHKLAIVIQGADKRNNRELANRYRAKMNSILRMEAAS